MSDGESIGGNMNRNTDLVALATEVQRQLKSRHDFVAPTPAIQMETEKLSKDDQRALVLKVGDRKFGVQNWAHGQIAEHLQIPARYYNRLRESEPELLAQNVNTLFAHDVTREGDVERRMVRVLDGKVRAVVSPKFFSLDNYDLLEAILPTIKGLDAEIINC